MSTTLYDRKHKESAFTDTHPPLARYSSPSPNSYVNESTPPPEASRINHANVLILVIGAIVIFGLGLVHLIVRYLTKRSSPLPNHQSNRFSEETPLQRQLQQLFWLHDSGLDQALIDALPVFYYKDIVGLKEPFDCAVCLCEFSENDMLRLLPSCSHAFHITCIDTWLLSNSTCPLCRGTLLSSSSNSLENPVPSFEFLREISNGFPIIDDENGFSGRHGPENVQQNAATTPRRVLSVRLGKLKSTNGDNRESLHGEMSSCINSDTRRCYSMGAFQYVLVDSDFRVPLSHHDACNDDEGVGSDDGELEGKKINGRARGESYSVSKIWLWSKKNTLPSSSSNAYMAELGPASSSLSYYRFSN